MTVSLEDCEYYETFKGKYCDIEIYVDRKTDAKVIEQKIRDYLELIYK
ncbi:MULTISPECIES: hypothetical protein [unclassified Sutcliffiella]